MALDFSENTTETCGTNEIQKLKDRIVFLENELKNARAMNKTLIDENEKLLIDNHFLDKNNLK